MFLLLTVLPVAHAPLSLRHACFNLLVALLLSSFILQILSGVMIL